MQRHNRAFNYLNVTKTSAACQCMELVIVWDKDGTKSSVGQYLVEQRTSQSEVLGSIATKVLLIDLNIGQIQIKVAILFSKDTIWKFKMWKKHS